MCTRRGRRPFGVAAGLVQPQPDATTRVRGEAGAAQVVWQRVWVCGYSHNSMPRHAYAARPAYLFGVATVWVCGCSHSRSHNTRTRRGRRRWWSRLTVVWQRVRVRLDPERLPPIIEAARLSPRDSWSPSAVFGWSLSATVALARDVPDGVGRSDGDRAGASARERGGTRGMPPRRSR